MLTVIMLACGNKEISSDNLTASCKHYLPISFLVLFFSLFMTLNWAEEHHNFAIKKCTAQQALNCQTSPETWSTHWMFQNAFLGVDWCWWKFSQLTMTKGKLFLANVDHIIFAGRPKQNVWASPPLIIQPFIFLQMLTRFCCRVRVTMTWSCTISTWSG